MKTKIFLLFAISTLACNLDAGIFNVLHNFGTPLNNTGFAPTGALVAGTNGTFYGVTFQGGLNGFGTVYSYNTNGSSYALWNFSGGSDGGYPVGDLVLYGTTLYGVASVGGGGGGTVYKVQTDGTGFSVIYSFTNGTDGDGPTGGLVLSGSSLYGVAADGGVGGSGVIFKVSTSGGGFQVLHAFTALDMTTFTNMDGSEPEGKLTISGNTLYGTTFRGGTNQYGEVYSMKDDGSAFVVLHSFAIGEALSPEAGLTLSGGTLYGTTWQGGSAGLGAIFSLNTDGTGYATLYSLANGGNDGSRPQTPLLPVGNILYGTAYDGGANGNGTIFSIHTDGTAFTVLYNFSAVDPTYFNNADGAFPDAGLLLYDGVLYGTAAGGGASDLIDNFDYEGLGTIFQINQDGSGFATDYYFFDVSSATDGASPQSSLLVSGNTVYGTTQSGGLYGGGAMYRMNLNATSYTLLHSFSGNDGSSPNSLVINGNTLYGSAAGGGPNGTNGEIFSVGADGSNFTLVYSLHSATDGASPSTLVFGNGMLYGAAFYGGTNGNGTIFSVGTNGLGFKVLHTFGGTDGANPVGPLTLSGNTLFGAAYNGGNGAGTLFRMQTDGTGFSNLRVFSIYSGEGSAGEGAQPNGGIILAGNTLYGTTYAGGDNHTGNVFKISTNGTGYVTLWNMDATTYNGIGYVNVYGSHPQAGVTVYGNMLYGTSANGGANGFGTLFEVTTNSNTFTGYTNLLAFNYSTGEYPVSPVVGAGGQIIGTASAGGTYGVGLIYNYYLVPPLQITTVGNAPFIFWPSDGQTHTLQMTTNLSTGVWVNAPPSNYTNADSIAGLLATNRPVPPAAYYRLMQ